MVQEIPLCTPINLPIGQIFSLANSHRPERVEVSSLDDKLRVFEIPSENWSMKALSE